MSQEWPKFSFTETLKPPDGWRTDQAILATYSADLVVIVTSLLALSGCDLEGRNGGRVELVRAIEALRGRVRILAQSGRVAIPSAPLSILRLLDKFLSTVVTDEAERSFHPKAALVRFQRTDDPDDFQWRVWLGSRNLTRAMNWEGGLVLASRADKKGQKIEGLSTLGRELAAMAKLPGLAPKTIADELSKLTWDAPPGCTVTKISLLGPGAPARPAPDAGAEKIFIVSPFLDAGTVRLAAQWGGPKARRTLVSTIPEIQRLWQDDRNVFAGFENICQQPMPELPTECAVDAEEENNVAVEVAESEEAPQHGLHAKLVLATKGRRRQLWIGSANATDRGWQGRNTEILAEMAVNEDVSDGLESFINGSCERYTPVETAAIIDDVEEALEKARKALSGRWPLEQDATGEFLQIIAAKPLPALKAGVTVEVASMGGQWTPWPHDAMRVSAGRLRDWERSDFVQVRATFGGRVCAWLQVAPCTPPPDEKRDHGLIAQYLDPQTFLWWLRSLLSDSAIENAGGDWDAKREDAMRFPQNGAGQVEMTAMPTVEEILKSWARDADSFRSADKKVKTYLAELQRRATESGAPADAELLNAFGITWHKIAGELQ